MTKLHQLVENMKANKANNRKLFEIETEVLCCQTGHELLHRLMASIQENFELHNIYLLLVDPTPINYLISVDLKPFWHQEHTLSVSIELLSHSFKQ